MSALIIMYLFTVLHKLNWDFLNPAVSCSVSMHKELATLVPFVPSGIWTHWPTIIGTLFFELIIPLGLWWRKTRVSAVLLGLFFHWFLALHPHGGIYSFSHLLYVLYTVFLFSSRDNPFDTRIKIPRFGVLAIKLAAVFLFGLAIFLQMSAYKNGNGFLQPMQSASTHGLSSHCGLWRHMLRLSDDTYATDHLSQWHGPCIFSWFSQHSSSSMDCHHTSA